MVWRCTSWPRIGTHANSVPKRNNSTMQLLPLFPLRVVVFPRTPLPLHIFEERYKELIGEAIQGATEFGIVLAKDDGIVNAGCTVIVEKVVKNYADGRMDILTRGVRRFEIVGLNEDKSYLRGEVEFFDDDEPGPAAGGSPGKGARAIPRSFGNRRTAR